MTTIDDCNYVMLCLVREINPNDILEKLPYKFV
jgi:hypothetical protein